jgi:hypothetical protein
LSWIYFSSNLVQLTFELDLEQDSYLADPFFTVPSVELCDTRRMDHFQPLIRGFCPHFAGHFAGSSRILPHVCLTFCWIF